jgi:FkbM family methyltransferase
MQSHATDPSVERHTSMARLRTLLDQDKGRVLEVERSQFDEMVHGSTGPTVLFGAGGLGRKTLVGLTELGIDPVAFADNSPAVQGTTVLGLPVLSPADAVQRHGADGVFVVTVFNRPERVVDQLNELGAATVVPFFALFWKYPEQFLPEYSYDRLHLVLDAAPRVREAAELLADDSSIREYVGQVWWRLDPMSAALPWPNSGAMYFPHDLVRLTPDEVFIDCGAYDGDTIAVFIQETQGQFRDAYLFEPDPRNLRKLRSGLEGRPEAIASRVHVQGIAVGKETGTVELRLGHAASSIVHGGDIVVRCEPLDAILAGRAPTYLKMDIEGAEIDALIGGREAIVKHRPVLAISAYHLQDHLWGIPLLVDSMVDGYRFYYRRYSTQPNDDLVLYAIPEERSIGSS